MNCIIRFAQESDLQDIVRLCAAHAAYEQADYDPQGKEEKLKTMLFAEHHQLHCLLVENDGEIIGYATFSRECSTWHASYYIHMDCLFIKENYRGFGFGEALVNEIVLFARKTNANHVEWQTPVFNDLAIKFYKKIGATSKQKYRFTLTI